MAYDRPCYDCGDRSPIKPELYYCKDCLQKLKYMLDNGEGVLEEPTAGDHCISCGQYENRRILYTGKSTLFSKHAGDGIPICDRCVEQEWQQLNAGIC